MIQENKRKLKGNSEVDLQSNPFLMDKENKDKKNKDKKNKLLIFDMDGVLIDVTSSYRETVRYVVAIFFKRFLGIKSFEKDLISLKEVADIKILGGLNNDWELTSSIINSCLFYITGGKRYYLEQKVNKHRIDWRLEDGVVIESPHVDKTLLHKLIDQKKESFFVEVYRKWKAEGGFIYVKGNGEVLGGDVVKRIFQEVYLGQELFKKNYGVDNEYYDGEGLIDRERLIPDTEFLFELRRYAHLAIATGRPRDEAVYPLKRFNIYDAFEYLITEDEIQKAGGEHLRKPNPFCINKCIEKFPGTTPNNIYYIGDMPDDMIAARAAGVIPVGFVNVGFKKVGILERESIGLKPSDKSNSDDDKIIKKHKEKLYKSGARFVFTSFNEILKLLR